MADASCMAGMAFANAFLGVCHSMAHKLGAFHHLPHGLANALLLNLVIEFNAAENPRKMGTFSQYQYPHTQARYAECARFVGIQAKDDAEAVKKLMEKIEDLKKQVGVKSSIQAYGIDEKDFLDRLDDMVEQAFDDQCTGANPKISSDERDQGNVLKSLLRKIIIKYKSNPLWVKPLSFVFGADRRPFGAGGLFAFGSL